MVAHTVALMMGSGKGKKPKLVDFLLRWAKRRQTPDEQLNIFRALAHGQGQGHEHDR